MNLILPCYILNDELLQLTKNAVESFGDVNLVVIDNASPLGGGYLRSVADIYIRNTENLGYAKAVNQGIKLTDGLKAIANNDVRVSPNWQEVTNEVFTNNPKAYSVHFRMIEYDEPFDYGELTAYQGFERWCSSSFFVIRGDELYDENLLNSYDDYDYWLRIRGKGLKTAYTNKASYQHAHSSTQQLIPEREENNKRNLEYFKLKHGEYPDEQFKKMYPEQMKKDWRPFP